MEFPEPDERDVWNYVFKEQELKEGKITEEEYIKWTQEYKEWREERDRVEKILSKQKLKVAIIVGLICLVVGYLIGGHYGEEKGWEKGRSWCESRVEHVLDKNYSWAFYNKFMTQLHDEEVDALAVAD